MKLGLIGKSLGHSFSPGYFREMFRELNDAQSTYSKVELRDEAALIDFFEKPVGYDGLNVTIPYKEAVIPFMDSMDDIATAVGAVNCIRLDNGQKTGFNTDAPALKSVLLRLLKPHDQKALILGSGGASKAVQYALTELDIAFQVVSRSSGRTLTYDHLTASQVTGHTVIINTTPLGMWPDITEKPDIPYQGLTPNHLLYDLIYNPGVTAFLHQGIRKGCRVANGYNMLRKQAELSWQIWTGKA